MQAGPSNQPIAGPSNQAIAGPSGQEATVDLAKHPSGIVPTLQNLVATVNLGCKLDLKSIALHARNSEYNPKVGRLSEYRLPIVRAYSKACRRVAACKRQQVTLPCSKCKLEPVGPNCKDGGQLPLS